MADDPRAGGLTEQTGPQSVTTIGGDGVIHQWLPKTYRTYRELRKHPTIALARALSIAPIVAADWSVEADEGAPDDAVSLVQRNVAQHREELLSAALEGTCDFGFAPFEVVYGPIEGEVGVRKIKRLLQDITTILASPETGEFIGFKQPHARRGEVRLFAPFAFSVALRVEGTNWYGEPLLENARKALESWFKSDDGATRYDAKVAGSHWMVYYPSGSSPLNGVETPNATIADEILKKLQSSGSVSVPRPVFDYLDGAGVKDANGWKIELVSDASARQASFVDRMSYLDKLMVRAMLVPERAILEGEFGTKAEAGVHSELALTNMELVHRSIVRQLNGSIVDGLLTFNYGPEMAGKVRLAASPIANERLAWLRTVIVEFLKQPAAFAALWSGIDVDAIVDTVGLPKTREVITAPLADAGVDPNDPLAGEVARLYADATGSKAA